MKRLTLIIISILCVLMLTNCKKEIEGKCDIRSFDFDFTESTIVITPIIGPEDNYSYTVVYSIDGTEIGRVRKAPYSITHELSEDEKAEGLHQGEIMFYGKHSEDGIELYIERPFAYTYLVSENGRPELIK